MQAHYRAAKAAVALGDFERAAAACDSGLALEPESADFCGLRDLAAKQAAAKQARALCRRTWLAAYYFLVVELEFVLCPGVTAAH